MGGQYVHTFDHGLDIGRARSGYRARHGWG